MSINECWDILSLGPRIENSPPTKSSAYLLIQLSILMALLKINCLSQSNSKDLCISMCIYGRLGSHILDTEHGTTFSVDFSHRTMAQLL